MMVFLHGFIICFMFNDEIFKKFYLYGQDFILITVIYLNILERSAFWRNPLPSTSNIPNIVCNFSWQDPEIKKNYWHYNLCVPKLCIMYVMYSHLFELSKLCIIKFMLGILMCMYFYIKFTNNFWIPFENITTICRKSLKDIYPLLSVSSILNMFSTKSEFGFTARAWANSSYWKKKNNIANF